jgi:hypothetical protein
MCPPIEGALKLATGGAPVDGALGGKLRSGSVSSACRGPRCRHRRPGLRGRIGRTAGRPTRACGGIRRIVFVDHTCAALPHWKATFPLKIRWSKLIDSAKAGPCSRSNVPKYIRIEMCEFCRREYSLPCILTVSHASVFLAPVSASGCRAWLHHWIR